MVTARVEDFIGLAIWAVRDLFIAGADREDLHQEACLGAVEAFRDYQPDRGTLATFVVVCARRRGLDAVKAATRPRARLLTDSIRLDRDENGATVPVVDVLPYGVSAERAALANIALA